MKKLIIEKEKLKHNIDCIKSMTNSRIIAVIKGNGYGLRILEYSRFLVENGIDFFAVSEIEEALTLRTNGFEQDILLLTSTSNSEEAELLVANGILPTVGSINSANAINEAAKKLEKTAGIHLKIDTGFGRFGFMPENIEENLNDLMAFENVQIIGTYSHLSFSFSKKPREIFNQYDRFLKCIETIKSKGINPGLLHIANSCAFLRYESTHLDAVRIGSAFLGRVPIENTAGLKRVGYMESEIIEIKDLPKGQFIGYANTYKTKSDIKIGVIPVGYKDGFGVEKSRDTFRFMDILRYVYNDLKSFHKTLYVSINGVKVKILGRISMYNIIVDLTGTNAKIGDKVILDVNPVLIESSIKREFV